MTQALIDTNVVLDVLLDRRLHVDGSAAVWAAIETGRMKGFLSAHAITTIHYLIRKELGTPGATRAVSKILQVFEVAAVNEAVIHDALQLSLSDFEDSVTAASARLAGCNVIVTRDPKGFRGSPIRPLTPEAFMPILDKH